MVKQIYLFIALIVAWYSLATGQGLNQAQKEAAYFSIQSIPIPDGVILEVGGLAFDPQGDLMVSTRRGEVWHIASPTDPKPAFKRFAHGLHEPLGLAFRNGAWYCAQRGELTKLTDKNGDGKADLYQPIYTWPLAANYHEYSYGPVFMPNGDMLVTLNLGWIGRGASLSEWRGWMLKITESGEMTPIATGMRSPAGFGLNAKGDIFYTENQGDWVGSGRMTHIESGDFVGHPEGLKWTQLPGSPLDLKMDDIQDSLNLTLYEYQDIHPAVKPPCVWFPHTLMGISTSDVLVIDGQPGYEAFQDQLLIGDQGHSKIMRVYLEEINGVYQGVCFGFREGFASGLLRMAWGPDGALYAGMTSRGWASTGRAPFGLERLNWAGKNAFEIQRVEARNDGFELFFTHPVNPASVSKEALSFSEFTYKYHHVYGSPPIQQQEKPIHKLEIGADHKSVRVFLGDLKKGFVYEIRTKDLESSDGATLLHPLAYYTLNEIPHGQGEGHSHSEGLSEGSNSDAVKNSPKHPYEMPSSWTDGPDISIEIGTEPGLQFDVKKIQVKAGARVKLTFNNDDDMLHNLLLVQPGSADAVGEGAMQLGLQGQPKAYVPDMDEVLYHTILLEPHSADVLYFEAPKKPGKYPYVCTFPGHAAIMRGIMVVKP